MIRSATMTAEQLWFTVLYVACVGCASGLTSSGVWLNDNDITNSIVTTGYLDKTVTRSKMECSVICSQRNGCISFYFTRSDNSCQTHSSIFSDSDPALQPSPQTSYYILESAATTTTSTTTTTTTTTLPTTTTTPTTTTPAAPVTSAHSCPSANVFTPIQLSAEAFSYQIMTGMTTFSGAHSACSAMSARLAVVRSVEKMERIQWIMSSCSYAGSDYWVDVTNQNAPDKTASGAWVALHDNQPVPMSNDFWGIGYPNKPTTQNCARMRAGIGYLWDDTSCGNNYGYICELN